VVNQKQIDQTKTELTTIKAKIDRVNNGFAEGSLDIQEFRELKNPLVPKKVELEERLAFLEKNKTNRLEPLRNWILEANQSGKWVSEENWLEIKSFLKKVGSNRLLREQTLTVSFKEPWNLLSKTVSVARERVQKNLVGSQHVLWWRRRGSNPRPKTRS